MKRLLILPALLLCMPGCHPAAPSGGAGPNAAPTPASVPGFPRALQDDRGKTLILPAPPRRIVSIAPSETEVLFDLGLGDRIVGNTDADDFPPEARKLPHVGGMMDLSLESIEAKNPDLVVAVGSINQKTIDLLDHVQVPTLVVNPQTVEQAYASIRLLGKATGTDAKAEELVASMQARIEAVRKRMSAATKRTKVCILYDVNPIYTTGPGSFIDDLIRIAGGQNVVEKPIPGNILSSERVVELQPDVILCDSLLRDKIRHVPGWAESVPAVRNNALFMVSDQATLIRPTPRLALGAEELARFLHPELK